MSQTRQLAAIMFTDIVGYTKLMGENEQAAFFLLKKNREIQKPIIEQYRGKWLKEMGDGVLASFNSVSDAVYCAKAIQTACQKQKDLNLRIGIHQGEVVFEDNDVFGDGVNIASRLEPMAPVGGILISESVHRNILNKGDLESVFVKEQTLKNVQHPVRIYQVMMEGVKPLVVEPEIQQLQRPQGKNNVRKIALTSAGILVLLFLSYFLFRGQDQAPETPVKPLTAITDKSIAVIPFVNISNDPEQDYFSDGMMEEILNHLVKVGELKVTSRTSAMQYKDSQKSIKEIAAELGVAHILEGSVRKSVDKVRITVQLIDTNTDQHLWSESYDRELNDVFAIQSEVAQQVAAALNTQLQPEVVRSMDQVPTVNMEAYDLYLKALNNYQIVIPSGNYHREWLERAIELDSNFSSAYALLGNSIIFEAGFAGEKNAKEVSKEAKEALEKALLLDPLDGIAHSMTGAFYLWFEKDFRKSEIEFRAAQELAPSDIRTFTNLVDFLMASGRFDEAIAPGRRLLELENSPVNWARMSLVRSFNNDLKNMEVAIEYAKLANSDNVLAYTEIARAYLIQKKYQLIPDVLDLAPDTKTIPRGMGLLAVAYYKMSILDASEIWLENLIARSKLSTGGSPAFYVAMLYASRGEIELAFQWLEQSIGDNEIELYWLKVEPEFASLHDDPRWQKMLDRIGFP